MMYLGANFPNLSGQNLFQRMAQHQHPSAMMQQGAPTTTPMAHLSHGGDAHETEKLDLVHLSPHEAHMLDEIQGGSHRTHDGVRMYSHLGHMMNHPDVHEYLHHASHERRMAAGGMAHMPTEGINQLAHHGMYHDTEMAYMPRHMQHVLDHMIGGADHNPIDGKKQYFLGDMLGSLKSAFNNPGAFINTMTGAPQGSQAPGWGDMASMAKNAFGQFARGGLQNMAQKMSEPQEGGSFYGNMGRGLLGSLAQKGLTAMDNPGGAGFDFSRQGLMNAGKSALGSAARFGVNKAFDMADRYMQPQGGGGGDEGGYGGGNPGSFQQMMGQMGGQYGSRAGSQYGSQFGGAAGRAAGRVTGGGAGEDYNPEAQGAERGGAYGANLGNQFGSRAGGLAGRLMDRGFGYMNQRFPAPQAQDESGYGGGAPQEEEMPDQRRPSYGARPAQSRGPMPQPQQAFRGQGVPRRPMPSNRGYGG